MPFMFWQARSIIDALRRGTADRDNLKRLLGELNDEEEFAETLAAYYGMSAGELIDEVEEAVEDPAGPPIWSAVAQAIKGLFKKAA